MTHEPQDVDTLIERAAAQIAAVEPDPEHTRTAAARVWSRLAAGDAGLAAAAAEVEQIRGCEDYQALLPAYLAGALPEARRLLVEDHTRECVPCRRALNEARQGRPAPSRRAPRRARERAIPFGRWALAAALLAGIAVSAFLALEWISTPGPSATVASVGGDIFRVTSAAHLPLGEGEEIREGEIVRTGRAGGAVLRLRDGSRVEMRARSQLAIDDGRRGTRLELERGSVIVEAAPQRQRHLWVATEDCLVSVTGTIFSVNHGTKGSRVAVIEGEVKVDFAGDEALLRPGEQLATNGSLSFVPLANEIAWSRDVDHYLELLGEYASLRRELDQAVSRPGLRYSSRLLDLLPEGTVFYAGLPNLGETLTDTHQVLRQRLEESPALAELWQAQGGAGFEPMIEEIVGRLGELGDALGEEVVISGQATSPEDFGPLVLAEVRDGAGLRDLIERQLADGISGHAGHPDPAVVFVDDPLAPVDGAEDRLYLWVGDEVVAAATRLGPIAEVARIVLEGAPNPFTESAFYEAIAARYADGIGALVAADLETLVRFQETDADAREGLERTGLADARHLMLEQKREGGTGHYRAAVSFRGERRGVVSWLAAPAPMGTLDFISPDAKLALAVVFEDPVEMFDDLASMTGQADGFSDALALFEGRHGLSLRDDVAAALGGELAFALDGPLLPTPAWKLVVEVYDPARLQWALEQSLADVNGHLAEAGEPALEIERQEVGSRVFYTLRTSAVEIHYAYVEGYLVAAPDRGHLDRAIRFRGSGYSLTDSPRFAALLPADGHNNFSALAYQDVSGVMQAVAERLGEGQLSAEQQQTLDGLKGESSPALGYAYGERDRITLATAGTGDALTTLLMSVLGVKNPAGVDQLLAGMI